jgi:hypothetical protein
VMMVQDSITWTGARAPGVERRMSLAWRCSTEQVAPTLNGEPMLLRRARRVVANLSHATGMLGASLTEAGSGKALSDRPALEPYWRKPAVRNLRGDDGNGGIIRSPIRAIVLPDPSIAHSDG